MVVYQCVTAVGTGYINVLQVPEVMDCQVLIAYHGPYRAFWYVYSDG